MSEQIQLGENEHRDNIVCPGCGHYRPGAGAAWTPGPTTCDQCGTAFTWRRNIIVTYTTKMEKA